MSIIIKTEEINYLIYRYLQEQGLQHSAFSLNYECHLDQIAKKYYDETRPGHLVQLLEKALVFQQLQEHIHMGSYYECTVPTQLISRHICNFTEKKSQLQNQENREKEMIIAHALNRQQEFQNTNKQGQTLDYGLPEEVFLKQVDFVKFPEIEEINLWNWNERKNLLATYQANQNCIKYYNCQSGQGALGFQTIFILPTCIGESIHRVKCMKWDKAHGNYLLILFENGVAQVTDSACQIIKMFNIKNVHKINTISWNLNWPNVAAIIFDKDIEIIDVFKCCTIRTIENCLYFSWRFFDQFILMDNNYYINLYQIDQEKPLLSLKAELETSLIEFNSSKSLLASFSRILNNIKVWSLQSDQYVFEITDDQKILSFCWCSSQYANYLVTLSLSQIIVWDVEFGQIKSQYSIEDSLNIIDFISLDLLGQFPTVALTTKDQRLIIYDLVHRKRRIISLQRLPNKIIRMNDDEILLIFPNMLSVMNIKKIDFSE